MFSIISRTKSLSTTLSTIEHMMRMGEFTHVISLNPENIVEAIGNEDFKVVYEKAELVIADGIGISIAARLLQLPVGDKITGIDLMELLIRKYPNKRIAFVGGHNNVAQKTLEYFAHATKNRAPEWIAYPDIDKHDPTLIHKVIEGKPDIIFVAFGSPAQELWIEKNRTQLPGVLCMGVGQAFDVYGGRVKRAPRLVQKLNLEWIYRLITQPWRWRRQLRLIKFISFVIRYRIFER